MWKCIRSFQKQDPSFSQRLEDDVSSDMIRKTVIFGHIGFSQVGSDGKCVTAGTRPWTVSYCVCSTVPTPRLSLIEKVPEELD